MGQETRGTLFDIGRFRHTDGPGIRTILFFKGCPLRCKWCSNPFGLSGNVQLSVNRERCKGCGECLAMCPKGINRLDGGKVSVDFRACTLCGACVPSCPEQCRAIVGHSYTVQELFAEACRDAAFYRKNGGGVTLSGGEPLMQKDAVLELLHLCKANYLNTCLETSGYTSWEILQEAAQACNTIFVDLKHSDSEKHRELTGVSNDVILENIRRLCSWSVGRACRVILRIPIIPGCNDEAENLWQTARWIAALEGSPEVNLLPYHRLGESKYEMIGEAYTLLELPMLHTQGPVLQRARGIFVEALGQARVSVGGDAIAPQRGECTR